MNTSDNPKWKVRSRIYYHYHLLFTGFFSLINCFPFYSTYKCLEKVNWLPAWINLLVFWDSNLGQSITHVTTIQSFFYKPSLFKVSLIMLTALLISALFYAYITHSKFEYAVTFLRSKRSLYMEIYEKWFGFVLLQGTLFVS